LARATGLPALATLDLQTNDISDDGACALAETTSLLGLVELNLDNSAIGPDGVSALEESLPLRRCRILA
jgi:hypothetical protein